MDGISFLSKKIVRMLGWRLVGTYPNHLSHVVIIVAPHTSNWDFVIGVLIRSAYQLRLNFIGKASLFRFPLGGIMRGLGGIPVERRHSTNFVEATAKILLARPRAHIALSPEGTRSQVEKFRTGFYFLAQRMDCPIQLVSFDWEKKEIRFGELFQLSGDPKADLNYIWAYFKGVKGYNPTQGIL